MQIMYPLYKEYTPYSVIDKMILYSKILKELENSKSENYLGFCTLMNKAHTYLKSMSSVDSYFEGFKSMDYPNHPFSELMAYKPNTLVSSRGQILEGISEGFWFPLTKEGNDNRIQIIKTILINLK